MINITLMEGNTVESTEFYDTLFKNHISKTKIKNITPAFYKKDECTREHMEYVATLENGKEISTFWLKRV